MWGWADNFIALKKKKNTKETKNLLGKETFFFYQFYLLVLVIQSHFTVHLQRSCRWSQPLTENQKAKKLASP